MVGSLDALPKEFVAAAGDNKKVIFLRLEEEVEKLSV